MLLPGTGRLESWSNDTSAAAVRLSPDDLHRLEDAVPRSAWSGDRRSFAVPVTSRSA